MNSENKIRRVRRWALALLAVLGLGVFATRPNVASETQDLFFERTAYCLHLLLTDFPKHQLECVGPGIPPGTYVDINGGGGGGGPVKDPCVEPSAYLLPVGSDVEIDDCYVPCDEVTESIAYLIPVGTPDCGDLGFITPFVQNLFATELPEVVRT